MPNMPMTQNEYDGIKRTRERSIEAETWKQWYSSRKWRSYRLRFLAKHPLCVECEKNGIITMSTEVDHIIPHKGDISLFWDPNNHQSLCKPCHSTKTVSEGAFGK